MQNLFSYGTLQDEAVQLSTFKRTLQGTADSIVGYELAMLEIKDPKVVATSGKTHHPILRFTGNPTDTVSGTVFLITDEELSQADEYEVSEYRRVSAPLLSGQDAWVYIG